MSFAHKLTFSGIALVVLILLTSYIGAIAHLGNYTLLVLGMLETIAVAWFAYGTPSKSH